MTLTDDALRRARQLIPGTTQLLSKKPELFLPEGWPAYYRRAKGCEIEDLDGRRYVDVTIHGVGTCPLGYADPDVERAVVDAIRNGSTSSLNCAEEVELAELLVDLHPFAEQVRYARGGGEAMAVAARLARATTGRDAIAFSGYHGWQDWYVAANLDDPNALDAHLLPGVSASGVPSGLAGTMLPFAAGDEAGLDRIATDHGDRLAAIVLEPARYALPRPGHLEHVREVADRLGAVLVFDEITSGFRAELGGIHKRLGVEPDVAVFAKAIANGYPMAAIVGRRAVMSAVERSFVSSTSWSERIGPTAALATIRKLADRNVPATLCEAGERMRAGWIERAGRHGLEIRTRGIEPLPTFGFLHADQAPALATLYTQSMLDQGFLASGAFYASLAHTPEIIDASLAATDHAFAHLAQALSQGDVSAALRGPIAYAGPSRR